MSMPRVLVVGAGATGSCTALRLRQLLGRDVRIEVWEKARGPGGRMSTNRQELGGVSVRADMGAQYLSLDGEDVASAGVADMLVKAGVCADVPPAILSNTPERRRDEGYRHLAGVAGGVNDALKHLLEESGAELHCEKRVASLDEQQGQWRARPFDGAPGFFDAVVLAVPGCGVGGDNLNKIHGGYEGWFSADQNSALTRGQHDARWSFALYLAPECKKHCDEFFGGTQLEKVVDSGPLHLLCYQSRKTAEINGEAPSGPIAIVAHTSLDWAKRNARANGRDERLLREVSEHVKGVLGISGPRVILESKVITWKQSQVTKPCPSGGKTGPCMLVSDSPALALAGDYFTESSFSGCLRSGFAAAEAVANVLGGGGGSKAARSVTLIDNEAADMGKGGGKASKGGGSRGGGRGEKGPYGGKGGGWSEGGKGGWGDEGKSKGKGRKGGKDKGYGGYDSYDGHGGYDSYEKHSTRGKGKNKGYGWQPYSGA